MAQDCCCDMDPCPCYGEGYADGKDKAFFEIEVWERGRHFKDCGCRPCIAARQILAQFIGSSEEWN